jgi:hypothetical protein
MWILSYFLDFNRDKKNLLNLFKKKRAESERLKKLFGIQGFTFLKDSFKLKTSPCGSQKELA